MKKLYLHIGAHKAASTTIQKNLIENRELLLERDGVRFLSRHDLSNSSFIEHFKNLSRRKGLQESEYRKSLEVARSSIVETVNEFNEEEIFISWEGIFGHSALDIYEGIYTHVERVAESLVYIADKIDIKVLLIVRRQDEFIESCYLQQVKERRTITFDEFTDKININNISWYEITKVLDKYLGEKIKIVPFEYIKDVGTRSFIEFVLFVLTGREILLDGFSITEKSNPSYSQYGVEMALELLPKLNKESQVKVGKMLFNELGNDKFKKARFFSNFNRSILLEFVQKDNTSLLDEYIYPVLQTKNIDLGCTITKNDWENKE